MLGIWRGSGGNSQDSKGAFSMAHRIVKTHGGFRATEGSGGNEDEGRSTPPPYQPAEHATRSSSSIREQLGHTGSISSSGPQPFVLL